MVKTIQRYWRFVGAYVRSMRLYYAFITGLAGWIGVAYYAYEQPEAVGLTRKVLILVMLFLSWGVNQIVNDWLGLAEDRINAPHRPMVTGELPPSPALTVSGLLMLAIGVVTWRLQPLALAPLVLGVALNVLYEVAKAWSLWGNIVFGCAIAMCTVYGYLACGPPLQPLFAGSRIGAVLMVVLMNGLMTFYTYFKDVRGDRRSGKRTLVVRLGLRRARYAGLLGCVLPIAMFFLLQTVGMLPTSRSLWTTPFIFCACTTLFLQGWTACLYLRHPYGVRAYFNLAVCIRACAAGQATVIAAFNGSLGVYLLCASYVLIGFLFDVYKDAKA